VQFSLFKLYDRGSRGLRPRSGPLVLLNALSWGLQLAEAELMEWRRKEWSRLLRVAVQRLFRWLILRCLLQIMWLVIIYNAIRRCVRTAESLPKSLGLLRADEAHSDCLALRQEVWSTGRHEPEVGGHTRQEVIIVREAPRMGCCPERNQLLPLTCGVFIIKIELAEVLIALETGSPPENLAPVGAGREHFRVAALASSMLFKARVLLHDLI